MGENSSWRVNQDYPEDSPDDAEELEELDAELRIVNDAECDRPKGEDRPDLPPFRTGLHDVEAGSWL